MLTPVCLLIEKIPNSFRIFSVSISLKRSRLFFISFETTFSKWIWIGWSVPDTNKHENVYYSADRDVIYVWTPSARENFNQCCTHNLKFRANNIITINSFKGGCIWKIIKLKSKVHLITCYTKTNSNNWSNSFDSDESLRGWTRHQMLFSKPTHTSVKTIWSKDRPTQ